MSQPTRRVGDLLGPDDAVQSNSGFVIILSVGEQHTEFLTRAVHLKQDGRVYGIVNDEPLSPVAVSNTRPLLAR